MRDEEERVGNMETDEQVSEDVDAAAVAENAESNQIAQTDARQSEKRLNRVVAVATFGLVALFAFAGFVVFSSPAPATAGVVVEEEEKPGAASTAGNKTPAVDKSKDKDATGGQDDSGKSADADEAKPGDATAPTGGGGAGSTTPPSGGNGSGGNQGGSGSGGGAVWHEPWDEWVSSGYWDTQYVYHEAVWLTRTIYGDRCNDCGYTTQGSIYPHQDATGHMRFSGDVPIGTEPYEASPAWSEEVKTWVDTSHNVHHDGYWS